MSTPYRLADALQGARNMTSLVGLQPGEQVVVWTDTRSDIEVAQAMTMACLQAGAEAATMVMRARDRASEPPPTTVAAALKHCDVFFPILHTVGYSNALFEALAKGARLLAVSHKLEALCEEAAIFPVEIVFELCRKLFTQWRGGRDIHITCDRGSDFTARIVNPQYVVGGPTGTVQPGTFEGFFGGTGDAGIWPAYSGDGVLIFDGCEQGFPEEFPLKEPLVFICKDGRVVNVKGGDAQVRYFKDLFSKHPDANLLAEIMTCVHPKARTDRTIMEATRHAGCTHVAVGTGIDRYEDPTDRTTLKDPTVVVEADGETIHVDNLMLRPTVEIDGELCVEDGELVLLHDTEIRNMAKELGARL